MMSRVICEPYQIRSYRIELVEHPVAPISGQRSDARYGFDIAPFEKARQACLMREQHADTCRVALGHRNRTRHWHGRRLQYPQVPACPSSAYEALENFGTTGDRR